jgi:hypothetical protein
VILNKLVAACFLAASEGNAYTGKFTDKGGRRYVEIYGGFSN